MDLGINQSDLCQLNETDLHRVCKDIAEFGFKSVRFAVDWGWLSNFWGSTNYAPVVRVRKALREYDLTPMPVLGCHYPLFRSASSFGNFTRKCVDIFGTLPYYEVWNEPNLLAFHMGTPAAYLKYLQASAPHIRAVGSKVISAGLAAYPTWGVNVAPDRWLAKMYAAGEAGLDYDYFGYHPYSILADQHASFVDPRTNPFGLDQMWKIADIQISMHDLRPHAYTEVGFTVNSDNLEQRSEWIRWQLNHLEAQGYPVWFFCWRDTAGDGGKFGIVDSANKPKGLYYETIKDILH